MSARLRQAKNSTQDSLFFMGGAEGISMKAGNFSLTATSSALTGYAIILVAVSIAVLAILDPFLGPLTSNN